MASTVEIVGVLHVLSGRCGLNARQRKRCVCRPLPQPETRCRAMARQTVAGRDRRGAVAGSVDHGQNDGRDRVAARDRPTAPRQRNTQPGPQAMRDYVQSSVRSGWGRPRRERRLRVLRHLADAPTCIPAAQHSGKPTGR